MSGRARAEASIPGAKLPPRDRRKLILDTLAERQLSRADIADATQLNKQVVVHWLRVLRNEQQVRIVGDESPQSRNVKYERTPESWGLQTLDIEGI